MPLLIYLRLFSYFFLSFCCSVFQQNGLISYVHDIKCTIYLINRAPINAISHNNDINHARLPTFPVKQLPAKVITYNHSPSADREKKGIDTSDGFTRTDNDIQFKINTHKYTKYDKEAYIKYRLLPNKDTSWHISGLKEINIVIPSLIYGKYNFKAVLVEPSSAASINLIDYHFSVFPLWWRTWWFKVLNFIIIFSFISYLIVHFYANRKKFQKLLDQQQQSIKDERQRISGEIHDEIGSGLFAIQLFADLLGKKKDDAEIGQISNMINEISDKIREIIWSTNTENNNLENLLYYVQAQTTKLFQHSEIIFKVNFPTDIPDIIISDEVRRNTYLIVKEIVHNAIKHSEASDIALTISLSSTFINIIIMDNGIGFDPDIIKPNAMGLVNVRLRIEKLMGTLMIKNKTEFIIKIPYTI